VPVFNYSAYEREQRYKPTHHLRAALCGHTSTIRMMTVEGVPLIVVPVVALVEGVMQPLGADCPELVPLSVLSTAPEAWAGYPAMFGHPTRDGKSVSAESPGARERLQIGTILNSRYDGRLLMDVAIMPKKAEEIGAGVLLERLRAGEPCDVSVGCHVITRNSPGIFNGKPYTKVWTSLQPDHLAFVTKGACSFADGCGVRAADSHNDTGDTMPYQSNDQPCDCHEDEIPNPYEIPLRARRAGELGYDPDAPLGEYPQPSAASIASIEAAGARSREKRQLAEMSAFRDQVYALSASEEIRSSERLAAPIPDPYAEPLRLLRIERYGHE
jgi:hypothetical protein